MGENFSADTFTFTGGCPVGWEYGRSSSTVREGSEAGAFTVMARNETSPADIRAVDLEQAARAVA